MIVQNWKQLFTIQTAGPRVTCVNYNIKPRVDPIRHAQCSEYCNNSNGIGKMALWLWYTKYTGSAIYQSVKAIAIFVVVVDSNI